MFAMVNLKMQPSPYLIQDVHPDLYRVDDLNDEVVTWTFISCILFLGHGVHLQSCKLRNVVQTHSEIDTFTVSLAHCSFTTCTAMELKKCDKYFCLLCNVSKLVPLRLSILDLEKAAYCTELNY